MFMSRQTTLSPRRSPSALNRLRFQLPLLWIMAVALPGLVVYEGLIPAETRQAVVNSTIGAAIAVVIGQLSLRKMTAFPGVNAYSFILPSLAGAYSFMLVCFLGSRLPYSRAVFGGSFALAMIVVFGLAYLRKRLARPTFLMVPGGNVQSLANIEGAEWQLLGKPAIPADPQAILVADFQFDHAPEWERMLAEAAISGRIVYHSKLLKESLTGRVTMEHLSENSFGSLLPNLAYHKVKRVFDLVLGIILFPFFVLPMAIIAICIMCDSPGTPIFRQERVGYRGEIFKIYKFRTMAPRVKQTDVGDARRDAMTRDDDRRITRLGKFLRRTRLDELPQIMNVIRGDMSWIGPRPEAAVLSHWYEDEVPFYIYRHIVRPGLSGWAQVNQGHVTELDSIHEKLAYDFYYVKYFSAWLDLVISFRTLYVLITGTGAR
jgi:lipopolysaccharide/colanic/teichoic acid biosynthesis glycosyltransferase